MAGGQRAALKKCWRQAYPALAPLAHELPEQPLGFAWQTRAPLNPVVRLREFARGKLGGSYVIGAARLSGSDPVEAIEQENGMPVDDLLRPVNSLHGAFESTPVHAFGLSNVVADPAIGAELPA